MSKSSFYFAKEVPMLNKLERVAWIFFTLAALVMVKAIVVFAIKHM
jgi:hypothetical protein